MPAAGDVPPRHDADAADVERLLQVATVLSPTQDPQEVVAQAMRRAYGSTGDGRDLEGRLLAAMGAICGPCSAGGTSVPAAAGIGQHELRTVSPDGDGGWGAMVADALVALPPELGVVVQLVDGVGLGYEEASVVLGRSVAQTADDVREARRRLRLEAAAAGLAPQIPDRPPPQPPHRHGLRRSLGRRRADRCLQVADLLQRYLDGELEPLAATAVRRHLRMCRRCGLEVRTYRLLKDAVSTRGASQAHLDPGAVAELQRFAANLRQRP